jgi:hypothetical protein
MSRAKRRSRKGTIGGQEGKIRCIEEQKKRRGE